MGVEKDVVTGELTGTYRDAGRRHEARRTDNRTQYRDEILDSATGLLRNCDTLADAEEHLERALNAALDKAGWRGDASV